MASNRRHEPARAKAAPYVVQAITEGKGSNWLAEKAGISNNTACDILAEISAKVHNKVERELGLAVDAMRGAATAARTATIARAVRSGELADSILAEGHALLDGLDCTETGLQRVGGHMSEVTLPRWPLLLDWFCLSASLTSLPKP